MDQSELNLRILGVLSGVVSRNPYMNFGQILVESGLVSKIMCENHVLGWVSLEHEHSYDSLGRVLANEKTEKTK